MHGRRSIRLASVGLGLMAGLCLALSPAVAQSVGGRVLEEGSLQPVAYTGIALLDSAGTVVISTVADSLGSFYLRAGPGRYRLRAERIGYATVTSEPVELRSDEPVIVELRVSASGIPLEPLIVRARGIERGEDAFKRRRALGEGVFLDGDSVALREPRYAHDVFRGVDGINVVNGAVSSFSGGRCMAIYIDNNSRPYAWYSPVRSRTSLFRDRRSTVAPGNPNLALDGAGAEFVTGDGIRGVEVYRNFWEIPEELRTADRVDALWPGRSALPCGMAIIWTRIAW